MSTQQQLAPTTTTVPQSHQYQPFPLTATQEAYLVGRTAGMEYGSIGCHGYWEWQSDTARPHDLADAWHQIVQRHPALRTVMRNDGQQHVLQSPPTWEMPINDLRHLPAATAEQRLLRIRESLSHKVFDPYSYPLWDVQVSLLPDGSQRIHFSLDLLVADAWSYFQVLVPELALSYEGQPLPPPPERTFRDHVLQAQDARNQEPWQAARDYWDARLDTLPSAPDLPTPRTHTQTTEFGRLESSLPPQQWEALKQRAARAAVTPTVLIAGVFAEVLRAWGAGRDFVVNLPVFSAGRAADDTAGVVGDFTSTILLQVDGTAATFTKRCAALQRQLWKDLPHADYSGVHVARALARQRGNLDVGFPVVLTSLLGQPPRRFHTSLGEAVYVSTQTPQVSLDFQVSEVNSALTWSWDFRRSAFPDGLMETMFEAFDTLVLDLADDPNLFETDTFDLMPAAQKLARATVNDTAGPVSDECLHAPLVRAAERSGDTVTVIDARAGDISAQALDAAAQDVTAQLAASEGSGPVAVLIRKGWRQLAAAHGVTRHGSAYLPLDPDQPVSRLQAIVAASNASVIVTESELEDAAAQLRTRSGDVLHPIVISETVAAQHDSLPRAGSQVSPTDPAYIIFTSGSTGTPKGVQVPHRGAANAFAHMNELLNIGPADRCLAVSGLHFDLSVYDVFGMFMAGGSVVLPDPDRALDPAHWVELVQQHQVTVWNSVPALFTLLVEAAERTGQQLPSLRAVILAGDWIPVDLPRRAEAIAPGITVMASGGPAETCVWSIHNLLPTGFHTSAPSIPYGRPMRNQQYRIVDEQGRDVPDWVSGEMCVESAIGLADGYVGDLDLTAQKFRPLPGSTTPAYRTGDVGRFLPDGSIEFLGRSDFQVKISGVRVELGDVEAALRDHPSVQDAVVVASPTQPIVLSGFVLTTGPGADRDLQAELLAHAAARLPRAAVPSRVTVLERWPLSTNGKVDRLALRERASTPTAVSEPDVLTDPVEIVLAEIWSDCIEGTPHLGQSDNYFMAGGSSMGAIRAAGIFAQLTGVDVSAKLVFLHPTLQDCARAVRNAPRGEHVAAICAAVAAG